jgi:hypothetical protein
MERKCEAGETDDAATGLVGVTKTGREQGRRVAKRQAWRAPVPERLFHIRLKVP